MTRPNPTKVVATVDGTSITAGQVEGLLWDWKYKEILDTLIEFQVVATEAKKRRLSVTPEEVQAQVDQTLQRVRQQNPSEPNPWKLLVAQGKFAEAEKLLAPLEAQAHGAAYRDNADVLATSMMSLGMARTGLAEFTVAEPDLLWAQPILVRWNGPNGKPTRKCTQALIDLYTAWNTAQPGKGYDVKAAEWKRKLDALGAPAPAAVTH